MKSKENTESNVLFQKLGNIWYVFSEINGEAVYSALPSRINPYETKLELYEIVEDHMKKVAKVQKRRREASL